MKPVGIVFVTPVILQSEVRFHVALGIMPPFRVWLYIEEALKTILEPATVIVPELFTVPETSNSVPATLFNVNVVPPLIVREPPELITSWSSVFEAVRVAVCVLRIVITLSVKEGGTTAGTHDLSLIHISEPTRPY